MLTCGAVHLRHYHAPDDRAAAARIVRASKAKVLTLLRQVIDAQTPMNLLESKDIEYIMAALLSCTVASVSFNVLRILLINIGSRSRRVLAGTLELDSRICRASGRSSSTTAALS